MILMIVAGTAAHRVQFLGKIPVDHFSGIIFCGTVYEYYLPAYIGGIVVYLGLLAVSYKQFMMEYTLQLAACIIPFRLLACIIYLFWAAIMFFTQNCVAFLCSGGLGGIIKPEFMSMISIIGWPAAALLLIGADLIKKSYKNSI